MEYTPHSRQRSIYSIHKIQKAIKKAQKRRKNLQNKELPLQLRQDIQADALINTLLKPQS